MQGYHAEGAKLCAAQERGTSSQKRLLKVCSAFQLIYMVKNTDETA